MTPAELHKLTQWFSPSYPVGAFSYSHGLEWAISVGVITNASNLREWLHDVLHFGAGRNDAIFLAQAYGASPQDLMELAELAVAFNSSTERVLETNAQGAAFAKATHAVWGDDLKHSPYPVVVGAAAFAHNLPLPETISLYLHAFLANLVSAAVRFLPLGQNEGQTVLAALTNEIEQVVSEAVSASLDDLGGCALRGDMAAMLHETLPTRIFRT